eukprot:XP_011672703.1 PREDICTED: deleted in malignant brain tumors 1 protein-like [Strongylocentrotus purpuratus]
MLGFAGALEAPRSARFGQGSGRVILNGVSCDGTEENIADCVHQEDGYGEYCGHTEDAGVVCYSGAHPNPFQVRLVGGSKDTEGRVEVLNVGSWGIVCDLNWDLRDARVVCRMLGYDGAVEAPRSARFGKGSGRIILTDVSCVGTEENLADCARHGVGEYEYCSHAEDAVFSRSTTVSVTGRGGKGMLSPGGSKAHYGSARVLPRMPERSLQTRHVLMGSVTFPTF